MKIKRRHVLALALMGSLAALAAECGSYRIRAWPLYFSSARRLVMPQTRAILALMRLDFLSAAHVDLKRQYL